MKLSQSRKIFYGLLSIYILSFLLHSATLAMIEHAINDRIPVSYSIRGFECAFELVRHFVEVLIDGSTFIYVLKVAILNLANPIMVFSVFFHRMIPVIFKRILFSLVALSTLLWIFRPTFPERTMDLEYGYYIWTISSILIMAVFAFRKNDTNSFDEPIDSHLK